MYWRTGYSTRSSTSKKALKSYWEMRATPGSHVLIVPADENANSEYNDAHSAARVRALPGGRRRHWLSSVRHLAERGLWGRR